MQFSIENTKTQKTIQSNTTNQPTNPQIKATVKWTNKTQTTPHQAFGDTESATESVTSLFNCWDQLSNCGPDHVLSVALISLSQNRALFICWYNDRERMCDLLFLI